MEPLPCFAWYAFCLLVMGRYQRQLVSLPDLARTAANLTLPTVSEQTGSLSESLESLLSDPHHDPAGAGPYGADRTGLLAGKPVANSASILDSEFVVDF